MSTLIPHKSTPTSKATASATPPSALPSPGSLSVRKPTSNQKRLKIVEKAQRADADVITHLKIGILERHHLGDFFPAIYDDFRTNYPHIQVDTHLCSFGTLIEELYQRDVDIIITLDFDVVGNQDIKCREISTVHNSLVVPMTHRLAHMKDLTLSEFRDDIFIVNSPEDSRVGYHNLVQTCKRAGFNPKLKAAASLDEYMLWLEIGYGITV